MSCNSNVLQLWLQVLVEHCLHQNKLRLKRLLHSALTNRHVRQAGSEEEYIVQSSSAESMYRLCTNRLKGLVNRPPPQDRTGRSRTSLYIVCAIAAIRRRASESVGAAIIAILFRLIAIRRTSIGAFSFSSSAFGCSAVLRLQLFLAYRNRLGSAELVLPCRFSNDTDHFIAL